MNKYGRDFKVKGNTLLAYTGSSQFMIVPEGIERISKEFESKVQLEGIILPKSLLYIEEKAFYKSNLCNVNLVKMHDSIEIIRTNAFYTPFEFLEIKNSYGNAVYVLEKLHYCSYNAISNLREIKVTENKLSNKEKLRIKELFPNCKIINENYTEVEDDKKIEGLSKLSYFNIPSTVEVIGWQAFSGKIVNLTIPETVRIVSAEAFYFSNIEFLTIYDSLEKIGVNCFDDNLKEITIVNTGKAYNLLFDLKGTHSLNCLRQIKIVGEPLSLFESTVLKIIYGKKVTIKYQPLEENVLILPEPKQEEQKTEEIKDEEALELLNKIRSLTKSWSKNQKKDIENKIQMIIREYRQKLEDTKNNFNLDETLELTPVSPSMIRETFLVKLESLYRSIYQNKYNDLLIKINDYETWLKNNIMPEVPNEIISVEDKIKFIIYNSFTYEKRYLEVLKIILSNTKQKISNISLSTIDNTPLLVLEDIDTRFETEISNLCLEVSRRKEIEETLKGKNQTELGKDIRELLNIINEFSKTDKESCLKELSSIIQKYFNLLLSDSSLSLNTIELDLRRELLPLMAKIITIKPVPSLNKIKERIDKCLNVLEENNTEVKGNILLESVFEIKCLINNENLKETEKEKMIKKLKEILTSWKSKIEVEEDECLNFLNEPDMLMKSLKQDENELKALERIILEDKNLQIELLILSELLTLKGKIEEKINRNKECAKLLKSL